MRSRAVPAVGALALLALVVVAAAVASPWRLTLPEARMSPAEAPSVLPAPTLVPPPDPVGGDDSTLTAWLVALLWVLLLAAAFLLARSVVRRIVSGRRPDTQPSEPDRLLGGAVTPGGLVDLPALVDAVDAALARLDDAGTPHDAVVAAWVELERASARHGWERHAFETSTEFTGRLLGVSPAPPEHVATLRRLYQQARFTTHPVTPAQVSRARAALESIARALDGRTP
ncbi:DUF4129 domain-containing protein [Xylanimonas allomyrinae]|uniref:DUF4129 domain-containing protein n=1 Tax=Xylanimonas allomyrinae TaxID=2509459 RepID=A0A4P6EXB1_9MICO|nr:DUF4129 domain-containing protein [Xylanimonas allomyrinae]QAY62658.1 DUF4129 domain-containing protein [Xylanimonas allomyrinae]